jgi:hypothetical protein
LEFVKSFTASSTVKALSMDETGDSMRIRRIRGLLKFYDVSTFDATAMMQTRHKLEFCGELVDGQKSSHKAVAVAAADSGNIYLRRRRYCGTSLQQTLTLHAILSRVTALAFNAKHHYMISTDSKGIVKCGIVM